MGNSNGSHSNDSHSFDRRKFLAVAGSGVAGVGLAGCSGGGGNEGTTTSGSAGTTSSGSGETYTTASEGEVKKGGKLVWAHSEQMIDNDIHLTAGESSYRVLSNVHEPLVGLTRDLNLSSDKTAAQPGLAKDWEASDDLLTYTFTLREGIKDHSGKELTAEDVKYSFDRIRDPDIGANNQFIFKKIESTEAVDKYTFRFTLKNRFRRFIAQLAFYSSSIIPKGTGPDQESNPLGYGPFKWESRSVGEKVVMTAFDDYWNAGPYVDTLEQRTATDPNARLTSVETGEADITNDVPLPQINDTVGNEDDNLKTKMWNPLCVGYILFNNTQEPFDDQKFRQAIDYAIDKQQIVDGALYGNGVPTESGLLPPSKFRNTDLERRGQDIEAAKQHFEESKYDPGEFELNFMVSPNYPWHVEAAKIMQQMFAQAGLTVNIEQVQWNEWFNRAFNLDYTITFVNWFEGWDPSYWLRNTLYSDGAYNMLGYESDKFDTAMDNAATADTQEKAIEYYKEAQAIRHEETPTVNVWFRKGALAAKQNTNGLATLPNPDGSLFRFEEVWLDE
ncbi:MAG: ABC transporter substrate-binding protein [Haloglomus sp.]